MTAPDKLTLADLRRQFESANSDELTALLLALADARPELVEPLLAELKALKRQKAKG